MNCVKCGEVIDENSKICGGCGSPVGASRNPGPKVGKPTLKNPPNQVSTAEKEEKKKGKKNEEEDGKLFVEKMPKFCPDCGAKTDGRKFCSECGIKLIKDPSIIICPKCGGENKNNSKFCGDCGLTLNKEKAAAAVADLGTYQEPSQGQSTYPCSVCGGSLTFVQEYQRWYCYRCNQYA